MTAGLVLDASVAVAACVGDAAEAARIAPALDRLSRERAIVPEIWASEVANAFLVRERRRMVEPARTDELVAELQQLPIDTDDSVADRVFRETMALARRHSLTVYDAHYIELAQRTSLPLATLDAAMCRAARSAGIPLIVLDG